ncbi:unnamed protein product, partial [Polarella glacialis]
FGAMADSDEDLWAALEGDDEAAPSDAPEAPPPPEDAAPPPPPPPPDGAPPPPEAPPPPRNMCEGCKISLSSSSSSTTCNLCVTCRFKQSNPFMPVEKLLCWSTLK